MLFPSSPASNLWAIRPRGGTSSTPFPPCNVELHASRFLSVPGRNRTCDLLLRRQPLYPPELRGQMLLTTYVNMFYG